MLFRSLYLPDALNKNFKSCNKTFDITEFLLIPFQQLATFPSGGDLSTCSRLLKIIKVITLVCLSPLKVSGRAILFLLVPLFLFCGIGRQKKGNAVPLGL